MQGAAGRADRQTYVSSTSTESVGLGGSMPRPEGGDSDQYERLIKTVNVQQEVTGPSLCVGHLGKYE